VAWKVYNIHSGRIVKAGFGDEEAAKDWLEIRRDLAPEDFLVEEMDDEEEEEWAAREDEDDDAVVDDTQSDDVDYIDPDDGIVGGAIDADDEDEEEEEDEVEEEEDEDDY